MKRTEYQRLRAMLEADEVRLRAELAAVQRRLAALDTVWTEVLPASPLQPISGGSVPGDGSRRSESRLRALVRAAAAACEGEFNLAKVYARLREDHPELAESDRLRSSVSGALWSLGREDPTLEVVRRGKGRQPTVYRNKSSSGAPIAPADAPERRRSTRLILDPDVEETSNDEPRRNK